MDDCAGAADGTGSRHGLRTAPPGQTRGGRRRRRATADLGALRRAAAVRVDPRLCGDHHRRRLVATLLQPARHDGRFLESRLQRRPDRQRRDHRRVILGAAGAPARRDDHAASATPTGDRVHAPGDHGSRCEPARDRSLPPLARPRGARVGDERRRAVVRAAAALAPRAAVAALRQAAARHGRERRRSHLRPGGAETRGDLPHRLRGDRVRRDPRLGPPARAPGPRQRGPAAHRRRRLRHRRAER